MKFLTDSLIIISLVIIGIAIDGRINQVNKVRTNVPYGYGYCLYKTGGDISNCSATAWRRLTDKGYERCMTETKSPDICL